MNRKARRLEEKRSRRNSGKPTKGAFGTNRAQKVYRLTIEKKVKTFTRYMKEGKDPVLLKSRKAFLSAVAV